MENIWEYKNYVPFITLVYCQSLVHSVAGEYCSKVENGQTKYIQCDYGCCGSSTDRTCCSISTAVLIVACVISSLVVIALLAAIIMCCYKKYKDKRDSRVRTLRQEQAAQNVTRRNVEPPKPPSYVSAPPAYSEQMPEGHHRSVSVMGRATPSNQRFDGRRHLLVNQHGQSARNSDLFSRHFVAVTNTSGTSMAVPVGSSSQNNTSNSYTTRTLPGSVTRETPPPPYSEFIRGQTPANRRQPANTQPALPEESETPSSMSESRTTTQTTQRTDTASSGVSRLPVPTQRPGGRSRVNGQSGRQTRVTVHGTERPQTNDSDLGTLTIV